MANGLIPSDLVARIRRDVERSVLRARNGIKYVAGIGTPGLGLSPKDTVWTRDKVELWRYRSDARRYRPPVFLVMSLVSRSYILDLRPGNSVVEFLLGQGFDVFMLDWGVPDELEASAASATLVTFNPSLPVTKGCLFSSIAAKNSFSSSISGSW